MKKHRIGKMTTPPLNLNLALEKRVKLQFPSGFKPRHAGRNLTGYGLPVLVCLTAFMGLILAAEASFAAGRSPLPILRTVMDPRSLALGGANESEVGLIQGSLELPEGLSACDKAFGSSFARHQLDLWSGNFYYTQRLQDNLLVSGEISVFDYGRLDRSERNIGFTGEQFQAAEYCATVKAGGRLWESLHGSAALNYVWGAIDESKAQALTLDGGLSLDPDPLWYDFRVGMAFRHYPLTLKGYDEQTPVSPSEFVLGLSRRLKHLPLTLFAAGIVTQLGDGDYRLEGPSLFRDKSGVKFPADGCFSLGGEFEIRPQGWPIDKSNGTSAPLYLRFGYSSKGEGLRMGQRLDLLAGVSFGLGINVRSVGIDYAYAPMGALGDVHRV
ncbi:MAG: hypothetical protein V2A61_03930, partial [Calditrichota bacterium]